jgi:hypothetical protein
MLATYRRGDMSVFEEFKRMNKEAAGVKSALGKMIPDAIKQLKDPSVGEAISAGTKRFVKNIVPPLGVMGAMYAVPYGVSSAAQHFKDKQSDEELQSSYNKMFQKLPQLQEVVDRDGNDDMIRENFDILARMAPDVAKTPSMAAAFVHSALSRGPELFTTGTVKDMAQIQSIVDRNREKPSFSQRSSIPFLMGNAMSGASALMRPER